jgi:hypothetical protein
MRKYIFRLAFALTSAFFLSACEDSIDLDLGVPVDQIVIDAVINQTSDTQFIKITKSIAYLDNGTYKGYEMDTVGVLDTSNYVFHQFTYKGNGVYYFVPTSPDVFKFGSTYQLIAKDGADTYFSQSTLNSPTSIDSFTYSYKERGSFGGPEGNYITLWAKDKIGKGDFYWFKLFRNDSLQAKAGEILIAQDNSTTADGRGDGGLFIVPIRDNFTSRPFKPGETARVEILSITPEMYYYLNLISTQLNNSGLFAVPPSNIPSNIVCINDQKKKVLGFFCMTGKVSTQKLLIN